ncbi:uncharacterized protein SCHCODRAFT_02623373 [Schizophyllum commune H4-8]|uniref:uncharacterized protein n=1 Tax=Schizophyllum commune (strain H4-8 / FGSC 9210) TaxID=578458 RepID=UPI00215EACB6|nr:uncharacterized protein SCHCODRAFT_02623373 [Schizophyllum commune H4-8]KAI5893988.1 hypothetical protein SCHCODRAFT_02623373 [Schizophyllum commune H4-8]
MCAPFGETASFQQRCVLDSELVRTTCAQPSTLCTPWSISPPSPFAPVSQPASSDMRRSRTVSRSHR